MKNKFMNLHIFEESGNGGEGNTAGQNGNSGNGNGSQSGNAGYTFEQAEEIANNRAEKASRAALASFYRQQGLSEEQITTAIADFKAKQKAQQPDVDTITIRNINSQILRLMATYGSITVQQKTRNPQRLQCSLAKFRNGWAWSIPPSSTSVPGQAKKIQPSRNTRILHRIILLMCAIQSRLLMAVPGIMSVL